MAFEDGAFHRLLQIERRLRALPAHVRLRPGPFDRRVFRLFCFTLVLLGVITALPDRTVRVRALLLLIALLLVCVVTFALLDARSRRSR